MSDSSDSRPLSATVQHPQRSIDVLRDQPHGQSVNPTYLKRAETPDHEISQDVKASVRDILGQVHEEGDDALAELTARYDGVELDDPRVSDDERAAAAGALDKDERDAIDTAVERVTTFAERQLQAIDEDFEESGGEGITYGQRTLPVTAAGTYVPSGTFTHIASAYMSAIPAAVTGVDRIITCTPPQADGSVPPAQLYAMDAAGVDDIYTVGGAQAIGAMAYGTERIDPVDVVAGPGNVFVVEAKRQVFGEVGIDLLGGPTEVLVIADGSADPELVALDLLAQAEHTASSQAVLIATDRTVAETAMDAIGELLPTLETEATARECWEGTGEVAVVDDRAAATALADEYAMEHVQVMTDDPDAYLQDLHEYGSAFLGSHSPVVFGDKVTGPNHILPTHGTARFTGGCWVGTYLKTVTHQSLTAEGAASLADDAARLSAMEGMDAHRLSAKRRASEEHTADGR